MTQHYGYIAKIFFSFQFDKKKVTRMHLEIYTVLINKYTQFHLICNIIFKNIKLPPHMFRASLVHHRVIPDDGPVRPETCGRVYCFNNIIVS